MESGATELMLAINALPLVHEIIANGDQRVT